jgi:transposase-like protein
MDRCNAILNQGVAVKRRTRINYTPEQKAIIWDRYKQGDSLHDIARMFDRCYSYLRVTFLFYNRSADETVRNSGNRSWMVFSF